jgi:hypothetical protein
VCDGVLPETGNEEKQSERGFFSSKAAQQRPLLVGLESITYPKVK